MTVSAIPRELRPLVIGVIVVGAGVLVRVSSPAPASLDWSHFILWTLITLTAAAFPVRLEGGVIMHTTTASIVAATFDSSLPQPFGACWVALIGTLELRDIRRELPWYGTLYNRFSYVLSAFAAWLALEATRDAIGGSPFASAVAIISVGLTFGVVNLLLAVSVASIRTHTPMARVWAVSIGNVLPGLIALVPLGWLMAQVADRVGIWAALLFMAPLLLARYSFTKYAETRSLFFGTVSALSQAIDAKDGFTRGHADRVSRIAGAIARQMSLSERVIEQIELAGLLHDIGKIGVEDRVLMKPMRLDPDETELMRRHPIYGAAILEPSAALRPLVPYVLHHHENFNGTGYPEGLAGESIPLGSRIIIVADAYEAMTSDRIYRKAIGHDRAMDELSRYKGMQFDPRVVRALEQLIAKQGAQAFEVSDLPPINYETLAELRKRLARDPVTRDAHAG
ncbi:MAG: HD-GYP domain-containing protein [Chloroflexi bacterium]|nr:HD-GYP domain-containing protein [Chloroflexota bacterium]